MNNRNLPGMQALMKMSKPIVTPTQAAGATPPAPPTFNLHAPAPSARRNFADGGLVPQEQSPPGGLPPQAGPAGPPVGAGDLQAELERFMSSNPEAVQKIQEAIQAAIQEGVITMEDLQMAVQMALAAAQDPSMYPQLRQMAIQRGLATEEDLPQQYDQGIVFALLIAGQAIAGQGAGAPASAAQPQQQSNSPQQVGGNFAKGGFVKPTFGDPAGRADNVNINVSGGEFIVPSHVVERKGTEFFDKLIEAPKEGKKPA